MWRSPLTISSSKPAADLCERGAARQTGSFRWIFAPEKLLQAALGTFSWTMWADSGNPLLVNGACRSLVSVPFLSWCCSSHVYLLVCRSWPWKQVWAPHGLGGTEFPQKPSLTRLLQSALSFFIPNLHIWLASNYNPNMWFSSIFLHNTFCQFQRWAPPDILSALLGFSGFCERFLCHTSGK